MGQNLRRAEGVAACVRGVQHVGVTVEDLEKSVEFYTEVLGGRLVAAGDGFSGEMLQNMLFQREELDGRADALPDLRDGSKQVLDVRFISFGDTSVELLRFRDAGTSAAFGRPAASAVGSRGVAHLCFRVPEDVDINALARDLENECRRRGIGVTCNRVVRVRSEAERRAVALKYCANKFWDDPRYAIPGHSDGDFGDFYGCAFFYCKGPSGEQLEFCQTTRRIKALFDRAREEYEHADDPADAFAHG